MWRATLKYICAAAAVGYRCMRCRWRSLSIASALACALFVSWIRPAVAAAAEKRARKEKEKKNGPDGRRSCVDLAIYKAYTLQEGATG
jgi:hypothetical protein